MTEHEFGNFSPVAETYLRRPPFSDQLLTCLLQYVQHSVPDPKFADIGAGTGAIAYALARKGLSGFAIEPDTGMFKAGEASNEWNSQVAWIKQPGEATRLPDGSVDWICFSSSFHWMNTSNALAEAIRILRPGGHVTIMYLLMDLDDDPVHIEVENIIRSAAPALRRARPPIIAQMATYERLLSDYPGLSSCISFATTDEVPMSREAYKNYWAGSHDIPSQVDQDRWRAILYAIENTFERHEPTTMKFRSTAWHSRLRTL